MVFLNGNKGDRRKYYIIGITVAVIILAIIIVGVAVGVTGKLRKFIRKDRSPGAWIEIGSYLYFFPIHTFSPLL